jgi:hypothetical protein
MEPDPNKFSVKVLLDISLMKLCFKKFIHDQKVKQQGFLRVLWFLLTPKRLNYGHLLRQGSGSDQKGPDPTGSGSATLLEVHHMHIISLG